MKRHSFSSRKSQARRPIAGDHQRQAGAQRDVGGAVFEQGDEDDHRGGEEAGDDEAEAERVAPAEGRDQQQRGGDEEDRGDAEDHLGEVAGGGAEVGRGERGGAGEVGQRLVGADFDPAERGVEDDPVEDRPDQHRVEDRGQVEQQVGAQFGLAAAGAGADEGDRQEQRQRPGEEGVVDHHRDADRDPGADQVAGLVGDPPGDDRQQRAGGEEDADHLRRAVAGVEDHHRVEPDQQQGEPAQVTAEPAAGEHRVQHRHRAAAGDRGHHRQRDQRGGEGLDQRREEEGEGADRGGAEPDRRQLRRAVPPGHVGVGEPFEGAELDDVAADDDEVADHPVGDREDERDQPAFHPGAREADVLDRFALDVIGFLVVEPALQLHRRIGHRRLAQTIVPGEDMSSPCSVFSQ